MGLRAFLYVVTSPRKLYRQYHAAREAGLKRKQAIKGAVKGMMAAYGINKIWQDYKRDAKSPYLSAISPQERLGQVNHEEETNPRDRFFYGDFAPTIQQGKTWKAERGIESGRAHLRPLRLVEDDTPVVRKVENVAARYYGPFQVTASKSGQVRRGVESGRPHVIGKSGQPLRWQSSLSLFEVGKKPSLKERAVNAFYRWWYGA
jgi:hypothetical protein